MHTGYLLSSCWEGSFHPLAIQESAVIRPATASDSASIARIYNHFVLNTAVTFEEQAVSAQEMAERIGEVRSASLP